MHQNIIAIFMIELFMQRKKNPFRVITFAKVEKKFELMSLSKN